MAQDQSFRWRTILEVAAISLVIYYLLGTPGLSSSASSSTSSTSVTGTSRPSGKAEINHEAVPDHQKLNTENLVTPSKDLQCPPHAFENVHIFSTAPLVIYIDGFVSDEEADHLIAISNGKWQPSTLFTAGQETQDKKIRNSEKALIDRDDIVQCIEARALAFQGWPAHTFIERLWTQRYNTSGHYSHHFDWSSSSPRARRASTFMVYLSAPEDVDGGGTNFPRLPHPIDSLSDARERVHWCEFMLCEGHHMDDGVTFTVRKGAAVFWQNFDAEGRGYRETIHAGMPVLGGTKIGLNIWSWYQI